MHYKYSSILTIAYITFMYGFGMPVLFPIAMLSFLGFTSWRRRCCSTAT